MTDTDYHAILTEKFRARLEQRRGEPVTTEQAIQSLNELMLVIEEEKLNHSKVVK